MLPAHFLAAKPQKCMNISGLLSSLNSASGIKGIKGIKAVVINLVR